MANISRRNFIASAGLLLAGTLVGCGSNSSSTGSAAGSAASGTSYTIGVIQLTEHSALDATNKGFVEVLKKSGLNVKFDQQNAQNDQSACQTISSKFVSDGVDLIYAIATPAAQAAAAATSEIPIVGCAITDYAASGLVQDNDKPGTNVTGASDLTPVAEQLEMMQKVLPDVKKVGLLYCPTDNTIAAGAAQVGQICKENKLPFIAGEEGMCNAGGVFTLSINYEDLGRAAGEMAIKILKGEAKPEDMAIEHLSTKDLVVVKNEEMAEAIGLDLSALDA